MALSRRQLLTTGAGLATLGAAGAAGLAVGTYQGVLPWYERAGYWLQLGGDPAPMPTDPAGAVHEASFRSPHRPGAVEQWAWSTPPGHDVTGLPVVIALHGWNDTHRFAFGPMAMQHFQARMVREGRQPFVLAALDGRTFYWHRRTDGVDWARLVSDSLLAELDRLGADTSRLGLIGWSMGGYGALRLAAEELHGRVKAVGSMSTAIYRDWDSCPQVEAFDTAEDYARNNLNDKLDRIQQLPVHLACGWNDDYIRMSRWLAGRLHPTPPTLFRPGDHTPGFWRRAVPEQFRFICDHL